MPTTATISSFFTFTPGTKARASEVNTNFSTFRGHIIPVETATATSADNTYDLGSIDYQWKDVYFSGALLQGGQAFGGSFEVPILWPGTTAPVKLPRKGGLPRTKFGSSSDKDVYFSSPTINFAAGSQIRLVLRGYIDASVTGADTSSRWQCETSLYRPGSDVAGTTTAANVHTSTVDITHSSGTSFQVFTNNSLTLCDASGLINSVTVTTDSVLAVNLKRLGSNASDSYTGNVILNSVLISFG